MVNAGVIIHVVNAEGVDFGCVGQWPCSSFIGDGGSATAAALNGSLEVASHAGSTSLGIPKAKCHRVGRVNRLQAIAAFAGIGKSYND